MKILFVISSTTIHGGASKAFMQMLIGLISMGVKPLVILPNKNGLYQVLQSKDIDCIALNYRMSVYPSYQSLKDILLFIPRLFGRIIVNNIATIQLISIIKQFKPDIVHTNVSVVAIGYYAARLLKIPHVWHIREYGDLDFKLHYYPTSKIQQNRYKSNSSHTICITKDVQKHHQLEDANTSKVIYDGVLSSSEQAYLINKKNYFLFAGRLEPAKGILLLIDAYAQYCMQHQHTLPLYIAGSGTPEYTRLIRHKIQEYKIEDQIKLLGMRNDILVLYKEAKALIVPSLSEGFGFITAEAMFSGCLVIGNDIAGTKEQFDNGLELTGKEIALRYTTETQLIQHLIDVTDNPIGQYEPMILIGQEVVKKLYSTEQHVKKIYDFYKNILEKDKQT